MSKFGVIAPKIGVVSKIKNLRLMVKNLFRWIVFLVLLVTGFAGLTSGSVFGTLVVWLAAVLVLPPANAKLVEKIAMFKKPVVMYGVLFLCFSSGIAAISSAQAEKDKSYFAANKVKVLEDIQASISEKKPADALATINRYIQHFPEDSDLAILKKKSESLVEKINEDAKQAALEKEKQVGVGQLQAETATGTGSSGEVCTVSNVLHDKAFICAGTADVCGMDDKTILVVNGTIMPPHATHTAMIKPGYRCECTKEPMRTAHAKIECSG